MSTEQIVKNIIASINSENERLHSEAEEKQNASSVADRDVKEA